MKKTKKAMIFLVSALILLTSLATSALAAYIEAFNADSFKVNPGADIAIIDDSETYNKKAFQGPTRDDDAATHFATIEIEVPAAGKYYVWGMVYATATDDNSLYFAIDNSDKFTWDYMEIAVDNEDYDTYPYYGTWYWMYLTNRENAVEELGISPDGHVHIETGLKYVLDLAAGKHTIQITTREPGAKYNALLITDDENYDPNNDASLAIGIDPQSIYPNPAIAAAEAAAEAERLAEIAAQEAAEAAAAEEAANEPAPAPAPAPVTGDMTALLSLAMLAAFAGALAFAKKRAR